MKLTWFIEINIVLSTRNTDDNGKLLLPFQVYGNDAVTKRSLPPIFVARITDISNFRNGLNHPVQLKWFLF